MDKSETELLADWDVVSSADTEQGIDRTETKPVDSSSANGNTKANKKAEGDSVDVNEVNTVDTKTAIDTEKNSEQMADIEPDIDLNNEPDVVSEHTSEASAEEISELVTVIEQITEVDATTEQLSEHDDIVEQEAVTVSEEVTKPVEAPVVDDSDKSTASDNRRTTDENGEKIDDIISENKSEDRKSAEKISDQSISVSTDTNTVDNADDRATSSSLDSSMEHVQIEYCGASRVQDIPELIDLTDQDNALIESSSSDIDIIDENLEESITSSFVHPLSLSISSSIDTSSMMTTPSEGDKEIKIEKGIEDITLPIKTESHVETVPKTVGFPTEKPPPYTKTDHFSPEPEAYSKTFQKSRHDDERKESKPHDYQQAPRSPPRQAPAGILATILGYLRNMTHLEWSLLGGVMLGLYITVIFNQTNIFAVVERENVVSQMKDMIEELKQDNKMLKDQMLSEMKNEKVFSSFEHQIKELKKENSKLNHMLYDVVKVLEEQKDSHEKYKNKESDYATPFKKEINKLKEHINFLKIDNEDLQKQLVRMRYASYSQGNGDKTEKKEKEHKEEIKPEETSTDEISIDINSLRKWNELITLLSKELGLLSGNEHVRDEKPQSDFKNNISWYWKVFLREFKGTFKDFKENVTSIISDYKQANEKAVSEVYKFVKEFFTVEENNQQFTPPGSDSSQWKNIGDFVNDLKEKWTNIKDRIYTSDLKNILKNFKKSGEADRSSERTKTGEHESHDRKPDDFQFVKKPEQRSENFPSDQEKKYDQEQTNAEDAKWMFKRAELRAELRDTEEEDPSENWFLKRKRRGSEDKSDHFRY